MNFALFVNDLNNKLGAASFISEQIEDGCLWTNFQFIQMMLATEYLIQLRSETDWTQPKIKMGAKVINSPRLAAWHGDEDAVYTYSGMRNIPSPWTETLVSIRDSLQIATGIYFNSVLLNLYRSGSDSMGWHSDNELELGDQPLIASVSLGEQRKFLMKHKRSGHRIEKMLTHGSALIMAGDFQRYWAHCVPKTRVYQGERINLTFRKIV